MTVFVLKIGDMCDAGSGVGQWQANATNLPANMRAAGIDYTTIGTVLVSHFHRGTRPGPIGPRLDLGRSSESYAWYRVDLTNRSITDEARREAIRSHIVWLASKLDDDALNHQLISIRYELLAGVDDTFASELTSRASAIEARAEVKEEP